MKAPSTRAKGLATAWIAVAGCSPTSLATGDRGDDGGSGGATAAGSGGGDAGMLSGAGGGESGGSGATTLGGAGGSPASGGATAGGIAGSLSGSAGATSGGGSGGASGGADGGSAGSGPAGSAGALGEAPTFTELWNQTLENGCATPYCHDGSGKGWSGFDKATAYRTLVGAPSTTCPGETRVVAGGPDRSVLAAAVSHTDLGACDVPTMPRNRAKLSQADIDRILAWIRAGARDD